MTNEGIERRVIALAANSSCHCELNGKARCKTHKRFFEVARELVAQAHEEAAKAICHMCESGDVPVTKCKEHDYEHIYPEDEDGYSAAECCHAADIHALKDQLSSTPPPLIDQANSAHSPESPPSPA